MSVVVGQRGSYMLVAPENTPTARAIVYDSKKQRWCGTKQPLPVNSYMARGYWKPPTAAPELLAEVARQAAPYFDGLTAAGAVRTLKRDFKEWEHPRGRDGRWINKFAAIKVFDGNNPTPRIATVQDLRPDGVHVVYADHTTGVVDHDHIEVIHEKARLDRVAPPKLRGIKDLHGTQLHEGDRAIYTGTGGNAHHGIVSGVTPEGEVRFHLADGRKRIVKSTALRRNNDKEASKVDEGNKRRAKRADDKRLTQGQTPSYFYDTNGNTITKKRWIGNSYEKLFLMLGRDLMQRAFGGQLHEESGSGDAREGQRSADNAPLDFTLGGKYAVELKTMSALAKDHKVGMRGDSLEHKRNEAKHRNLDEMLIAQVVDQSRGVVKVYMFPRFGSPHVRQMTLIGEYTFTDADLKEAMDRGGAPTFPRGTNPFVVPEHAKHLVASAADWSDYDDDGEPYEIQPGDAFIYLDANGVPWVGTEPEHGLTASRAGGEVEHVFHEWQHPRGRDGRWIDKGGFVKVFKNRDDHSKPVVGQVHDLTAAGVVVHLTDGRFVIAHPDQLEEEHAVARLPSPLDRNAAGSTWGLAPHEFHPEEGRGIVNDPNHPAHEPAKRFLQRSMTQPSDQHPDTHFHSVWAMYHNEVPVHLANGETFNADRKIAPLVKEVNDAGLPTKFSAAVEKEDVLRFKNTGQLYFAGRHADEFVARLPAGKYHVRDEHDSDRNQPHPERGEIVIMRHPMNGDQADIVWMNQDDIPQIEKDFKEGAHREATHNQEPAASQPAHGVDGRPGEGEPTIDPHDLDVQGEAAASYLGNGYEGLNQELRDGTVSQADFAEWVRPLDEWIKSNSAVVDAPVYRGATGTWINELGVGDELRDPGFLSMTTDRGIASHYAGDKGAVFEFPAGHGLSGVDIDKVVYGNEPDLQGEREILMLRDARFIVQSISTDERGRRVIKLVPAAA